MVLGLGRGIWSVWVGWKAVGSASLELERTGQLDITLVPDGDDDDDDDYNDENGCTFPQGV